MWFSVSILLKGEHSIDKVSLWEENILLLRATTESEARAKGESAGRKMETDYISMSGQAVAWKYDCILSVYELVDDVLADGVVAFARHLRNREVDSLKTSFGNELLNG